MFTFNQEKDVQLLRKLDKSLYTGDTQQMLDQLKKLEPEEFYFLIKEKTDGLGGVSTNLSVANRKDTMNSNKNQDADFYKVRCLSMYLALYDMSSGIVKDDLKNALLYHRVLYPESVALFTKAKKELAGKITEDDVIKALTQKSYTPFSSLRKTVKNLKNASDIEFDKILNKRALRKMSEASVTGMLIATVGTVGYGAASMKQYIDKKEKEALEIRAPIQKKTLQVYDVEQTKALIKATWDNDFEGVKRAVENGADINVQRKEDGRTAFMLAAEYLDEDAAKIANYLLEQDNLNLKIEDDNGISAMDIIISKTQETGSHGRSLSGVQQLALSLKRKMENKMSNQTSNNKTYQVIAKNFSR